MEKQPGQSSRASAVSSQQAAARRGPALPLSRRFDESWVEVSSQPSSSSLSSVGDEIVTTGLHVGGSRQHRHRSQPTSRSLLPPQLTVVQAAEMSSQDEYEGSESEDDGLLTSSAEVVSLSHKHACDDDSDVDADDGDDSTALGRTSDRHVFRPQLNAFSYPLQSNAPRRSYSTANTTPPHPHDVISRPSLSERSQITQAPRNFMLPANAREDNDAALRASLTTLLSCAAAARGLPKTREESEARWPVSAGVGPSNEPVELRLIPESELLGVVSTTRPDLHIASGAQEAEQVVPTRATREKPKRAVSAGPSPRAVKKKKVAAAVAVDKDTLILPTLLTWVMSAGVVVLVSVVGFGAGYVIGREVGRQEGLSTSVSSVNATTRCGREVISSSGGLRRLRWGAVGKSIVAQA